MMIKSVALVCKVSAVNIDQLYAIYEIILLITLMAIFQAFLGVFYSTEQC